MSNYSVSSGQVVSDVTVYASQVQIVYGGGLAISTTVSSGGEQLVIDGAGFGSVIDSGGLEYVNGGTLVSAFIDVGGIGFVSTRGVDSATTVAAGGFEHVSAGGTAIGSLVAGAQIVSSAGVTVGTTVASGGTQTILLGTASGTVVDSGGFLGMSGGTAIDTVLSGGTDDIAIGPFGGTAIATEIYSGGFQDIGSNASASGTEIYRGGAEDIAFTAAARGTVVHGGGVQYVGGDADGTVISAGGSQRIEDNTGRVGFGTFGGGASNTTILSGGDQIIGDGYYSGFNYSAAAASTDIALSAGGTIDLADIPLLSGAFIDFNSSTDLLRIEGNGPFDANLQMQGDYTGQYFSLSNDGATGTDITLAEGTPCYCHGTSILTTTGEVPIERLRIGDHLITKSGEPRQLRWIGRRAYSGRFAAGNRDVLPILFRAGALGGGLPERDLHVSPLHAMYLEGVLIPAACLTNGDTILQVRSVDQVEYFHLELDTHDVIIAEGALSETYIDDDNRGMFHNVAEYLALYPGARRTTPAYCAPRVEDGDQLDDIRRRLRPAPPLASAPMRGNLDLLERHRLAGWAMADDGAPVRLRILDNGIPITELTAALPRADVREALGGDGMCGFKHIIEGGLAPDISHVIRVQRATDGAELPHSPWLIEPVICAAIVDPTPLRGHLDEADRTQVQGWACAGAEPVDLQIIDNGIPLGRVLANRFRADLANATHADGHCAFVYRFPAPLSPALRHVIEVGRASDGAALPNSPTLIEPATAFDTALQDAVAHAVAALDDGGRAQVLSFLLTQTNRLKQQQADADSWRAERADFWQFRRRWGAAAQSADPALRAPSLRALIIDRDLPTPDRDTGSQAVLSHMRALQRLGYAVSFVAAEQMAHAAPHLTGTDIAVCAAPLYSSVEEVLRRQSGCVDLIYLHRAEIAQSYMALARRWMPKARIVYSVADLHHLRLARQAEIEQRPELHGQSRLLRLAEFTAAWSADAVITHSSHEAALLRQALPHANIYVVPWEVSLHPTKVPFAKRHGLAFIANYAHPPNVDAARWLVEEVMPLVWERDPAITCYLAGAAMPTVICALEAPTVVLLGHVPSLATLFDQIRLTVAPLRYGAGIKGKVLDSLAAAIPCATTPIAAEGLNLPTNLIAPDPAALAAIIFSLHNNASGNRAASRAGRAMVERGYEMAHVVSALGQAIGADGMRATG